MPVEDPIHPAWLAEATGLSPSPIEVGQVGMFSSQVLRITRTGAAAGEPTSLILKRPNPANPGRLGESFGNEGRFYRELAAGLPVRTPACFAAGDNYLILEDVAFQPFNWHSGATPAHSHAAMTALRRLHLVANPPPRWIPSFADREFCAQLGNRFDQGWLRHRKMLLEWCPDFAATGDALAGMMVEHYAALGERTVLLQGDAHLENLPLLQEPNPGVVMFDWQGPRVGNPLIDVAFFIAMSYPVETRRRVEKDVLAGYVGGVVSRDDARAYQLATTARASGIVELAAGLDATRVAQKGFGWVVERCLQAAVDNGPGQL